MKEYRKDGIVATNQNNPITPTRSPPPTRKLNPIPATPRAETKRSPRFDIDDHPDIGRHIWLREGKSDGLFIEGKSRDEGEFFGEVDVDLVVWVGVGRLRCG